MKSRRLTLSEVSALSGVPTSGLEAYQQYQPIEITEHYSSLIDWSDIGDPLRQVVMPSMHEHLPGGSDDPSNESRYTKSDGLEHKYSPTALLLASRHCHAYCRGCFRKRLFIDTGEVGFSQILAEDYLRHHPEIRDVILSGGDPLRLSTRALARILAMLGSLSSIETVRIHTKSLAFAPTRVTDDDQLLRILRSYASRWNIVVASHFSHAREIESAARLAISALRSIGVNMVTQLPLQRGVNDSVEALADLYRVTSQLGCAPYYLFQSRPVIHGRHFAVPIAEGIQIHRGAHLICTGLERRARYVMSHETGKLEILGQARGLIVLRRLSLEAGAATDEDLLFYKSNKLATWLDELEPMPGESLGDAGCA